MTQRAFVFSACTLALLGSAAFAQQSLAPAPSSQVNRIKVQPDKAPDCSTLKAMVESVTRDCKTNDGKAIAVYNFMMLTHYHRAYPPDVENALKEINNFGWSLCGGLRYIQGVLYRELGWNCRFVGWPGHNTMEVIYDDRHHYLDVFLKFYAWMPDGKGGQTLAGEYDLKAHPKELIQDPFVFDAARKVVYAKNDQYAVINGKANWRAHDFLSCGDTLDKMPKLSPNGPPDGWMNVDPATGKFTIPDTHGYNLDVNLAPGMALTNTWDPIPDAWFWPGSKEAPGHTCPGHKYTRNNPGYGLVLEPYVNSKPVRSYGNGILTFAPDFSNDAFLKSFVSTDNVKYIGGSLAPAEAGKPASVVLQLASPYLMTKASGEAAGAAACELSVDNGKSWRKLPDLKTFDEAVKGRFAAQIKVTFTDALKTLKFEMVVQNNPGALAYLSPGKNTVSVSVADPKALGDNKLVVTYAYRLGARTLSNEQLCEQGKRIANQSDAKWSDAVTCVQKTFMAKDLPATFDIDCPTPKGQYPVYPRMMFVRREVLAPPSQPLPLPQGAVEAKVGPNDELMSLPNPFLVGTDPPQG